MRVWYNELPSLVPFGGRMCMLDKDWSFFVDGAEYHIPSLYFFDGASIPRPLWSFVGSPFEPCMWAGSIAHDWIYLVHIFDRSKADEILYQLIMQSGVGSIRAHLIWAGVRSGAWWAWDNTEDDASVLAALKVQLRGRPDGAKFRLFLS